MIEVEVVLALRREHRAVRLRLAPGATVADAVQVSGLPLEGIDGHAVFGERVEPGALLRDGDRVELLRPMEIDPKQARRQRAAAAGRRERD